MTLAQGRTLGIYNTDPRAAVPATFAFAVPNNLFAEGSLGWVALSPGVGYPERWKRLKPRHVEGQTVVAGKVIRTKAIAPNPAADIWTGVATSWTSIDNIGGTLTMTVTGYVGEAVSVRVGA